MTTGQVGSEDLDDPNNTELLRFSGGHPLSGARGHVSVDIHTCDTGEPLYIVYSQTEVGFATIEEAMVMAKASIDQYQMAGFDMRKVEL